jgi:protein-S-isoprenylcysteine O-methyltransferase Ste14
LKVYATAGSFAIDPSTWRMYLGLALAQASALLALAAVIALVRSRTTIDPIRPARVTALVTEGVFRLSRNPLYLSLLILLVAYAVRLDSLAVWLGPVLYLLYVTRFQIIPEERALQQKFGESFSSYRSRTRRWL